MGRGTTHPWLNGGYVKLRRITDRDPVVVRLYTHLAAAITAFADSSARPRRRYRWPARPATHRLK